MPHKIYIFGIEDEMIAKKVIALGLRLRDYDVELVAKGEKPVIRRMRDADAIIVGSTHPSVWGLVPESPKKLRRKTIVFHPNPIGSKPSLRVVKGVIRAGFRECIETPLERDDLLDFYDEVHRIVVS